MATFTDTIRFVVEAATGQARSQLTGLRNELAQAEGAGGKMRAGIAGIGGALRDNLGLGLAGAGTAIAAFATKAIGEFQSLALEADKMSAATGLALEETSRWAEVSGDLGVNVETVAAGMNRLNRAAAEGKLEGFGIATEDANERLLETLTMLQGVTDETERARIGQELLGRSWTELAPLIDSADQLRGLLAEVSDEKIIDQEEVDKAKRYRDAMDDLHGVIEDLTLAAGEALVPALSSVAEAITAIKDAVDLLPDLPPWMNKLLTSSGLSIGKDLIRLLPGGSGDFAATPGDIVREWSGQSPGSLSQVGGGTWPSGTTNITVNPPPGYRGDEIDSAQRNFWQTNGRVTWTGQG